MAELSTLGSVIKTAYEGQANTNAFTDSEQTKLSGIETAATADQTGAEIKTAYEGEANTNAFTDAEQTKLAGIETGATADQTGAEIKTAYEGEANTNAFTDAEQTKLTALPTAAEFASTATGDGASLIGIEDSGGFFTATDVEAALAEIAPRAFQIAVSDETTALSTGTAKRTFRMPYAMTLTEVRASVGTAPTGSVLTVDINEGGTTILSTKLTIDASEKTSETAATAAVISDSALADDAEITIDIDTVGSTVAGAGLKVTFIGHLA